MCGSPLTERKLIFLVIFFILGVTLSLIDADKGLAQYPIAYRTTSLSDIGYTEELPLKGVDPSHSFYFPIADAEILPEESFVQLHAEFSPVLPNGSLLKVTVDDDTAYTFPLKSDQPRLGFKVPIKKVRTDSGGKFLKITVSVYQFINEDFRYDTSSLWVNILPSSFLQIAFNEVRRPASISSFFSFLKDEKRVTIGIPKMPSAEEAESAVWVYSFLKRELGEGGVINVVEFISREIENWVPYVLEDNLIIIGKGISYGGEFDPPNLRLVERSQTLPDGKGETKRVLLITGENDDQVQRSVRGLLEDTVRNSSFGNALFIKKRIELSENENGSASGKQKISLRELGFPHFQVEGMGEKRINVFFSLGLYPRLPENLDFIVFGEHTPINGEKERGFLNVYLNGSLVKSFELEDGEINGSHVSLPSYILGRENTLGVEFSYLPFQKDGSASGRFKGAVYNTSHFEAKGWEGTEALFEHLPWLLLDPGFQIFFRSPPTSQDLKIAGELLHLFWRTQGGRETYPQVTVRELPPEGNLIAVLSPLDLELLGLLPPLLPVGDLRIINYRTERIIWGVEDGMSLGIVEVFKDDERNIVLGTYMGEYGKGSLLSFLNFLGKENNFLRLSGNIALGDGNENFYAFGEKEVKIEYPIQKFPRVLWEGYRVMAFIVAWLLLLSFTLYIYFRFQRG